MFIGDVTFDDTFRPFGVEQEHAERRCVARPRGLDAPSTPLNESLKHLRPILVGTLRVDDLPLDKHDSRTAGVVSSGTVEASVMSVPS